MCIKIYIASLVEVRANTVLDDRINAEDITDHNRLYLIRILFNYGATMWIALHLAIFKPLACFSGAWLLYSQKKVDLRWATR